MYQKDELIDHIRQLEKELEKSKIRLEEYEDEYIHQDDVTDAAYERGMIYREDIHDYIDSDEYVDADDHRSVVRALEELADAVDGYDECSCEECKDTMMSAVGDARCYV